ncbi:MAG: hypothetical protein IKW48_01985 [Akkermansia sp.]|nr:hypothetical protein [Akkermansia sp.]
MNKRSLLSCIIGLVWVSLLVVVLRTPVQWPVHEGLFGGLLVFCLYQGEISAWIRLGRTQKKENDTEGS